MKLINKIQFILFFTFLIGPVFGQNNFPYKDMVISTTGINMRNHPNLNGKIVTKIPFGEMVEVVDGKSYRRDTIGDYKIYYSSLNGEFNYPIIGDWVKIKYNGFEGFVFNSYLLGGRPLEERFLQNDVNIDYVILFTGISCFYNYWYNNELHWYGIYKYQNGYLLKKAKINFFRTCSNEMLDLGISASSHKDLLFVIGSKNTLNKRGLKGEYTGRFSTNSISSKNITVDTTRSGMEITLAAGGKKQVLNPGDGKYFHSYSSVIWRGDIDGDNKDDYIIHYGEKEGQTILYLSSEADENQIVKPVAVFYSGYCC